MKNVFRNTVNMALALSLLSAPLLAQTPTPGAPAKKPPVTAKSPAKTPAAPKAGAVTKPGAVSKAPATSKSPAASKGHAAAKTPDAKEKGTK